MSQYLLYSTLSTQIQDEMAGQAPDSSRVLRAVNAEVRNLNTKYDIDTFVRSIDIDVVTDGSVEYKIDTLVTTLDVRKIKSIRYKTNDKIYGELVPVDFDDFMNDVDTSKRKNQFTVYYKDGFAYLRVMTQNFDDAVEEMTMRYFTSALAIDLTGNFYFEVNSGANMYVLLPDTYLDLVCLGAQKRLFYQSIGDSDQAQTSLVRNRYESELKKLGLASVAKTQEKVVNKIKLRKQW